MQKRFIGDASDHWKGSMHAYLRARGCLRNLHVIPMATEPSGTWAPGEIAAYARLLGLQGERHVIGAAERFQGESPERERYFISLLPAVPAGADLFLDPNTGVRDEGALKKRKRENYVTVAELLLCCEPPERVVAVFDESWDRRSDKATHARALLRLFEAGQTSAAAYDAGKGVSMFFVSRSPGRIESIGAALGELLGPIRRLVAA